MIRAITATLAAMSIALLGAAAGPAHALDDIDTPETIDAAACPTNDDVPAESLTGNAAGKDVQALCEAALAGARTAEAAQAISYAFWALGSDIVCVGQDRMGDRSYDTSSLIARAYASAGLTALAGDNWAISSRDIIGWDGVARADWSIKTKRAKPGDIIGYKTALKHSRITDMRITKNLVITAAGMCGTDIVRLADTLKNKGKLKRTGYYYVDPELAVLPTP